MKGDFVKWAGIENYLRVATSSTLGVLPSIESVRKYVKLKCVYEPRMSADEREARMARWLDAAQRSGHWARKE